MNPKEIALLLNLENKSTDLLSQIYEYMVSTGERYITTQGMLVCLKAGLARQGYSWDAFPPAVVKWVERGVKDSAKYILKKTKMAKNSQGRLFPYPETLTVKGPNGEDAHVPIAVAVPDDFHEHWGVKQDNIDDAQRKLVSEQETLGPVVRRMEETGEPFFDALNAVYDAA